MDRPSDYRYTTSHEWVYLESENIAVIGITDHAVKELRDLVTLDYPDLEQNLFKGEIFGEIESIKAVADMHSPVAGLVIELNEALEDDIDILQRDAYRGGWMVKLKVKDVTQFDELLTLKAYEKLIASGK